MLPSLSTENGTFEEIVNSRGAFGFTASGPDVIPVAPSPSISIKK